MSQRDRENLDKGRETQRTSAKARRDEAIRDGMGRNPDQPLAGTQKWAEKHGLAEKKDDTK